MVPYPRSVYRSLGSLTTFGVPSGPYTGPPKRVSWHKLPKEVRERLQASLEGRGRPAPIAVAVPRPTKLAARLVLASAFGVVLLVALVVHSWPRAQALELFAPYVLAWLPLSLLVGFFVHRRLVRGGSPMEPGRVLLPLDLLSFDGHALTVTPLGSVRDVGVFTDAGRKDPGAPVRKPGATEDLGLALVLRFESGEEARFPMPSAEHADRTYDALVQAQRTLESVSYGTDLGAALDHDPFFGMRDGEGFALASAGDAPRRQVPLRAAFAPAVVLAVLLGLLSFRATNAFSDEMRFRRAFAENTTASMQDYLARGGVRVREAEYFIGARKMEIRKQYELDEMRDRVARNEALKAALSGPEAPKNPAGFVKPKTSAEWGTALGTCLRELTERAPKPSKILPSLGVLVDEARRGDGGPARLPIRFERTLPSEMVAVLPKGLLEARERQTARALAVVLAEACPPSVLMVKLAEGPRRENAPELLVRYSLGKPERMAFEAASVLVSEIRFDATVDVWPKKPAGFSLVMPAPSALSAETRDRSVFRIDERDSIVARVYGAYTARAFDRLYDELYGLFFGGEVKVPLPGFSEVERIFMK